MSAVDTLIVLTVEALDVGAIVSSCSSPDCGAVSAFVGTTRDRFEGRRVRQLSYEAYEPMARDRLSRLDRELRREWPQLRKVALVHRLGRVPVGDASVVVVASSPHRRDALGAVAYAIDRLKADVPIWKKEEYEDGGSEWKANRECPWTPAPETETTAAPPTH